MRNNNRSAVESSAISALAAASKTPFSTAFKVTLGIGIARLALFAGFAVVVVSAILMIR